MENSNGGNTNVGSIGNSIKEDIKILENWLKELNELFKNTHINNTKERKALEHILSDYKRVLKENEELKKDYYNIINKIENKIDRFDYEFEKAKRQNNKDKSDYYWDLIINFKKLLESEE